MTQEELDNSLKPKRWEKELAENARRKSEHDWKQTKESCLSMVIFLISSGMLIIYGIFMLF